MKYGLFLILLFACNSTHAQYQKDLELAKSFAYENYWDKNLIYLDSSLAILEPLIKKYPEDIEIADLYRYAGFRYRFHDSIDKAEKMLRYVMNNYSSQLVCLSAYANLGEVAMERGDTAKAIKILSEAYEGISPCDNKSLVAQKRDSISNSMDAYLVGQYLVEMLIATKDYDRALYYQKKHAAVVESFLLTEDCGTMYDVEKSTLQQLYYDIYLGLGDTVKAISSKLWDSFMLNYDCKYARTFKFTYEKLRWKFSEEEIRTQANQAIETIRLEFREDRELYIAYIDLYGEEVFLGGIYPAGNIINDSTYEPVDDFVSEAILKMRMQGYYKRSCYYKTMVGEL